MAKISNQLIKQDNLYLIKTNKYKDINVSIKCSFSYSRKLKAALGILSGMMQDTCKKYPTKQLMAKAKDMLYGVSFDVNPSNVGNLLNISFNYSYTNPKFLKGVCDKDYIDFINETLKNQNLTNDFFEENKRNLIDSLNRKLDNPSTLARNLFALEVSKDDAYYDINNNDIIEELKNTSLNDVLDAYNNLFNNRIDIFLIGDYSIDLVDYLKEYKSKKELFVDIRKMDYKNPRELNFKKEVGQSTLIVSYKAPYLRNDINYYAYSLANIMFGGIPSSLLFSEVREKYSLCYSIFTRTMKYESLTYSLTNIDAANKEKALSEIRKQFKRMVDGDYDHCLLDVAKAMLINGCLSIDDDLDYLMDYYYAGHISNTFVPMDEYIEHINKVTIDDISRVYSNLEEYIVYFLEGTLNEQNL